jgi:hypothetical protein
MTAPATPIFLPEIQSEDFPRHGNLPSRESTTSSASLPHYVGPGPTTNNSSFLNPTIVPSPLSFPPEIQSEDYPGHGSLAIKPTTTMASLEKRTIMARQGPNAASNTNPGFYSSAMSASTNEKPPSNQLYDTTKVPLNQGISTKMNTQSSSNRLSDMAKSPLKQGSEKDG